MQKLGLTQQLQQRLSPQQIQFIKLLELPTLELNARVESELEENPALEEGEAIADDAVGEFDKDGEDDFDDGYDDLDISEYLPQDDIAGYKMQGDGPDPSAEDKEVPVASQTTLTELLLTQLSYLELTDREYIIGRQLVGSIESDGYIRRELESIVNDLAFSQNVETTPEEVEGLLERIQQEFDPPGIGARDLQECLVRQIERRKENLAVNGLALTILEECFEEFTKKHYEKIMRKLDLDDEETLREALRAITRLNPKPGGLITRDSARAQYVVPDFILYEDNDRLKVRLNARNAPELRVSRSYADMLDAYDKSDRKDKRVRETVSFVKQKLDAAKWFIDAIKQRQQTLLNTMSAILDLQREYFRTGDESNLRPMILKDIADRIQMDISTVSRVASSKYVQTDFGVLPLKYFFSEGITTESGVDVSSREVKSVLKTLIEEEDKQKPLSDEKLEKQLRERGYQIARRTVAKYREQLGIPVARLRKQL